MIMRATGSEGRQRKNPHEVYALSEIGDELLYIRIGFILRNCKVEWERDTHFRQQLFTLGLHGRYS